MPLVALPDWSLELLLPGICADWSDPVPLVLAAPCPVPMLLELCPGSVVPRSCVLIPAEGEADEPPADEPLAFVSAAKLGAEMAMTSADATIAIEVLIMSAPFVLMCLTTARGTSEQSRYVPFVPGRSLKKSAATKFAARRGAAGTGESRIVFDGEGDSKRRR